MTNDQYLVLKNFAHSVRKSKPPVYTGRNFGYSRALERQSAFYKWGTDEAFRECMQRNNENPIHVLEEFKERMEYFGDMRKSFRNAEMFYVAVDVASGMLDALTGGLY